MNPAICGMLLATLTAPGAMQSADEAFTTPSVMLANQPFTFTAGGNVDGEVILVETVSGEVVARGTADADGRVYLATGLKAGAYIIRHGDKTRLGDLVVSPNETAASAPKELSLPSRQMIWSGRPFIQGTGFNPNAGKNFVMLGESAARVSACTADEIRLASDPLGRPGIKSLSVRNADTQQTAKCDRVMVYEAKAKLVRKTLASGERTELEFTFEPKGAIATFAARISGPANFGGGRDNVNCRVANGTARQTVSTEPGSLGKFDIAWHVVSISALGLTFSSNVSGETTTGGCCSTTQGAPQPCCAVNITQVRTWYQEARISDVADRSIPKHHVLDRIQVDWNHTGSCRCRPGEVMVYIYSFSPCNSGWGPGTGAAKEFRVGRCTPSSGTWEFRPTQMAGAAGDLYTKGTIGVYAYCKGCAASSPIFGDHPTWTPPANMFITHCNRRGCPGHSSPEHECR